MIGIYQQKGLDLYDSISAVIKKYLNINAQNAGFFSLPNDSYNALRQQYDAKVILKNIAASNSSKFDYKIGVVNVDIYSQSMNFIFGLADPLKRTALISTYRLAGDKIIERVSKEVIHEIGHLLGLTHCLNPRCVMCFSNTVENTDNKYVEFCKKCRSKID